MSYRIESTRATKKALLNLPTGVAAAVVEFIYGPLAENPHRVGKPLREPCGGQYGARRGSYRIRYRILDDTVVVLVLDMAHRADAHRPALSRTSWRGQRRSGALTSTQ